MATTTKNYGLTKPAGTDKYDIGVFNANADKIDAQMKANADAIATKQATITGGATSITSANLTASRALVSDGSGKVAVSAVTSTELGYLDGVTSAIQTQLNGKLASTGTAPKATADANGNNIANTYETKANAITGLDISGKVITYTKGNGTTGTITTQDTNTDTKNTAGSTDTSSKIFLIGATSQAANPQTYSHDTAYVGTDGKLYSGGKVVIASGDTATAANKLATTRAIDGVNFNGEAAVIHYGTCATAAATATKAVSITNFTLVTGARVIVKFTVTNTAANPTLNVNNTGAKAIQYRGAAITAGYLAANRTYEFVYDGTNYQLVGDINTDTNTDTKVTQTVSTANKEYPVLLKNGTGTGSVTNTVIFDDAVTINPSSGEVKATKFTGPLTGNVTGNVTGNCSGSSGSCTGNAASATKATQDANGKVIANTYATKSECSAKQDPIVAGTGISIATDGKTINHSNSVTAKTTYVGSATAVPMIKYDAQGHITATSTAKIYPPTTDGAAGQVWMSIGVGAGEWTSGVQIWEDMWHYNPSTLQYEWLKDSEDDDVICVYFDIPKFTVTASSWTTAPTITVDKTTSTRCTLPLISRFNGEDLPCRISFAGNYILSVTADIDAARLWNNGVNVYVMKLYIIAFNGGGKDVKVQRVLFPSIDGEVDPSSDRYIRKVKRLKKF